MEIAPPKFTAATPISLTVKWEKVEKSKLYEVQMKIYKGDKKNEEGWLTLSNKLTGNIMKKKNLEASTKYIFRFRGLDEQTEWSLPSEPFNTLPGVNLIVSNMLGKKLLNTKGKTVSIDTVGNGLFGLYFSASWCPPCRQFTPMLDKFYKEVKRVNKKFEIIFVSADHDVSSFFDYFQNHHPWLAIPYETPNRTAVSGYFQVSGIPRLIIFGPTGQIVCNNAVQVPLNMTTFEGWEKTAGLL
jgi:thiol-disulfide isomerase/thioredoxin